MRKFFVSLLFALVCALPSSAADPSALPKSAKLPDGSEVSIPDLGRAWGLVEEEMVDEFTRIRFYESNPYWVSIMGTADTDTPFLAGWSEEKEGFGDIFVMLVLESGEALAVQIEKRNAETGESEYIEGTDADLEPVIEDGKVVGMRAYLEYEHRRIAERVFKINKE